ncbi:aldo/keto reductase [Fodinicurvata sediminis]|uniref:aldo/keto reductase n=1 Tax=Fodinicurvata sediminis TaxID=1121832 RepID=UPI0003B7B02A|nr:aldo/keto reductase [Fodinicurvata sediminis]
MTDRPTDKPKLPKHLRRTRAQSAILSRKDFLKLSAAGLAATALAGGRVGLPPAAASESAQSMRTRQIPASGESLPVVGLGTWQQFDVAEDAPEMEALTEVVQRLFDNGGSVIDSSPMYGAAEARVGEILTELDAHDDSFLATKVWTRGRQDGIDQMKRSEILLETSTIDLMQVHNLVDLDTHMNTLRDWKAEGRIRYLGVTHYTTGALDQLADIIERDQPDFVQLAYSIGVRAAEERVLPLARDHGVAVLVNRPYEGGGVFRRVGERELPDWARDFCDSWGQFFLKYILANPAVTCVIPGTSSPEHMDDNAGAGYGRLPDAAELDRMRSFWEDL